MDLLAQIGGKRIAAPPAGATGEPLLDLSKAAERYRALLDLGDQTGVVPQVEVWGGSKNLHRLGQSMFVVIESGHPKACLLPDVYHIYKGGSDFHGLKTISSRAIQVFHLNDYPANPPRETIRDADRVMPGDAAAPLKGGAHDWKAGIGGDVERRAIGLGLFRRQPFVVNPVKSVGMDMALEALYVVHRMREHHHAALREHDVVVQVLRQVLPEVEGVVVEPGALVVEVVRADDRGVAPGVAAAEPALVDHRDVGDPVLLREIVGRPEPVAAG